MKKHDESDVLSDIWIDYCKLALHGWLTVPVSIPGFLYNQYQMFKNRPATADVPVEQ